MAILIGHARSGTTFLARALGSHPEVGYWEEPSLLLRADEKLRWVTKLADHLVVDASVRDLSRTVRDGNLRDQFGQEADLDEADAEAVRLRVMRSVVEALRNEFLARSGGSVLLEKTPREIILADQIAGWFPDAKIIHIVRDGRDVVCSGLTWEERWGRPKWVPKDGPLLDAIAQQWATQVGAALAGAGSETLVVRYEDLVANGRHTVAACVSHLELPWKRSIDHFMATGMGGLHSRSVGRWEQELTREQQTRITELAGDTLSAAGYVG